MQQLHLVSGKHCNVISEDRFPLAYSTGNTTVYVFTDAQVIFLHPTISSVTVDRRQISLAVDEQDEAGRRRPGTTTMLQPNSWSRLSLADWTIAMQY